MVINICNNEVMNYWANKNEENDKFIIKLIYIKCKANKI